MSEKEEGVFNRRMGFCKALLSKFNTDELYIICNRCDRFVCVCCPDFSNEILCHHYPVVFTDGACSANGSHGAISGIGGAYGEQAEHQWSIRVDDLVDANPVRTNQRAELLAAIEGVRRLGDIVLSSKGKPARNGREAEMVVATDSEYVCKGVTEWMPKWKVSLAFFHRCYILGDQSLTFYKTNGWRNSSGRVLSNKDLFCELDEAISALEHLRISVGFWWIDRKVHVVLFTNNNFFLTVTVNTSLTREPMRLLRQPVRGRYNLLLNKCKRSCMHVPLVSDMN